MTWPEPALFVWGIFGLMALGALAPLDVGGRRQEHVILTVATTAQLAIFGPRGLLLVWGAVALGLVLTRQVRWLLTTALAVTVGFSFAYLVYSVLLGRSFPLTVARSGDAAVAVLTLTVAWIGTMSVRAVSQRFGPSPSRGQGFDPFESRLVPYLLPTVGGAPVIAATVALYRPEEPWPALVTVMWCLPLYAACRFDLHQRQLGQRLRREAEARQQLAAIGEVTSRIVHQSRHHAGLMGWSIHRLRRLVGDPSEDAALAAEGELNRLAAAKERIQEAFETELSDGRLGTVATATRAATLGVVVRDVRDELADKARDLDVAFEVDIDATAGAQVVSAALGGAIFNLVDNALDAARGAVAITVVCGDREIEVAVADDGPGLADLPEPQRAFDPFVTTKAAGAGMGLAIADALVGEAGGRLHHERRDDLTRFVVALPVQG